MKISPWVGDSATLFDLAIGGILAPALGLSGPWETTDAVGRELLDPPVRIFVEAGLRVVRLTGPQIAEVMQLSQRYHRPSAADLSA